MKLIIEVPEVIYNMVINTGTFGMYRFNTSKAIKDGTPLDSVKTEIETDLSCDMFDEYGNETRLHKDLMNILDNIGTAESEE